MAKSLIFLFDGTANDATVDTYSNVYSINQLISESKKTRGRRIISLSTQITFYLPGVGTRFTVRRPVRKGMLTWVTGDEVRQQVFGDGLEQLVLRAYVNLCANYRDGDSLTLVGFSRGAAAARIFSRLISDFGILTSEKLMLLDRIWNEFVEISLLKDDATYFKSIEEIKSELHEVFKDQLVFRDPAQVKIKFMGLFDTVLGQIDDKNMRNMTLRDLRPASKVENIVHLLSMHDVRKQYELKRFEMFHNFQGSFREIWIPGVHSDVGGGYTEDLIGNLSLLTMASLMQKYGDIAIDELAYKKIMIKIKEKFRLGPIVINKEPFVIERKSRDEYIKSNDELHPLHWHLVGKRVYWKKYPTPVQYENRYEKNATNVDPELDKLFHSWIGGARRMKRAT